MKILLTSHGFPPLQNAGVETHVRELAQRIARAGHEVHVLAALKDVAREHLSLAERRDGDVRVHELANNLFHESFRETYDHPRIDAIADALLARLAPDVLHVQHLLHLSAGIVGRARDRGLPVLMTLHDFWLQCPRFGQRLHADGGLCATIDFERCGTCLPSLPWTQGGLERAVAPWIARVQRVSGVDLGPLARGAARSLAKGNGAAGTWTAPDETAARAFAHEARARTEWLRAHVVPHVDRFLAPSRFLCQRFVSEWGIPAERIEHVPFGIDADIAARARPARAARRAGEPLRVAFLGTLAPHKGPHLLLEAWSRLAPEARARAELALFGPARHDPAYQERLAGLARAAGARLGGALDRAGVEREIARAHLLVVPSLWYENSPLVILEAIAAGTPLLVADEGGMAELVEEGVSGFRFRRGDVDDLARQITRAIDGTLGLEALAGCAPQLPRFEAHVARVLELYTAARARAGRQP